MVSISSFMTLPHQFTTIRTIHKCEILTLQSDITTCWAKMCTGEETFHTPLTELYWTMVQTIQDSYWLRTGDLGIL